MLEKTESNEPLRFLLSLSSSLWFYIAESYFTLSICPYFLLSFKIVFYDNNISEIEWYVYIFCFLLVKSLIFF